jgi:hypothetical protein
MAKRFFYTSLGILCLVAAYQLGAERARADWDPAATGAVAGGDHLYWFSAAGEAWSVSSGGWQRETARDLPIPASQVQFLFMDAAEASLVTTDDVGWYWTAGSWASIGPFPGGPVSLDGASWGSVKGGYR